VREGEHARLAELERDYWWHVGRREILRLALDATLGGSKTSCRILDVGCGAGGNIELLSRYGSVAAMDDSPAALSFVRSAGHGAAIRGSVGTLPIRSAALDVIALLDVLEHTDDDASVLRECQRALKPGALLLLTVPAYQWLWSGHDEALGHRRRYSEAVLVARLAEAGFRLRTFSYAVCFLFPLIAGYRVLERLLSRRQKASYVLVPHWVNAIFVGLLRLEARLIGGGIRLPFGTSIIVAAVKPR
jgi:SAM-dependent methyltransferase